MTLAERLLYHQIHPLKLLTDPLCGAIGLVLLWRGRTLPALAVIAVPTSVVSAVLVVGADLRPERRSRAGKYLRRYITPPAVAVRLAAFGAAMATARWRSGAGLALALGLLMLSWFYGLVPGLRRLRGA